MIGFLYNETDDGGTMRYTLNGVNFGTAFSKFNGSWVPNDGDGDKDGGDSTVVVPVWSVDLDRSLSVNVGPNFQFPPAEGGGEGGGSDAAVGVNDLLLGGGEEGEEGSTKILKKGGSRGMDGWACTVLRVGNWYRL